MPLSPINPFGSSLSPDLDSEVCVFRADCFRRAFGVSKEKQERGRVILLYPNNWTHSSHRFFELKFRQKGKFDIRGTSDRSSPFMVTLFFFVFFWVEEFGDMMWSFCWIGFPSWVYHKSVGLETGEILNAKLHDTSMWRNHVLDVSWNCVEGCFFVFESSIIIPTLQIVFVCWPQTPKKIIVNQNASRSGWLDTGSSPNFTQGQKAYAHHPRWLGRADPRRV